ncbi:MAG: hypothetical protein H6719_27315 [Sandaracinaceae bacterium]|nr:hypothetical protein [Sandaracinaceae bacterium]
MRPAGLLLALGLVACAVPSELDHAPAPLLGAADGTDSADRSCQVILRTLRRAAEADGRPATLCADGMCWLSFDATVDVSDAAIADGGVPEVLFRDPDGADGWLASTDARPVAGAESGFSRFVVRFGRGAIRDGMTATALSRARLEVIAYLRAPSGSRVFDHNERPGDFDDLVVHGPSQFAFDSDPAICLAAAAPSADATITFDAAFGHSVEGALVRGGTLAIDYDPARLPQCIGDSYMARRAWDTLAWVRVLPSGEVLPYQSVIACDDERCDAPRGRPARFDLPADAEAVELWFSTSGRSCGVHYDSDFGRNYRFDIQRPVGWVGGLVAKISRAGGAPCEGAEAFDVDGSVGFGTWARTRSITSHVCFRVWSEGVTDHDDPALASAVQASLACTWDGETEARHHGVTFDARVGNDARYRADLRGLDPFASYRCPEVPTTREGDYEVAGASCVIEVNGASWGELRLAFSDYPDNAWRAANCAP